MKKTKYAEIELENPFTGEILIVNLEIDWTYHPGTHWEDSYLDCDAVVHSYFDTDGMQIAKPDWFDLNMVWPQVRELAAEDFLDS